MQLTRLIALAALVSASAPALAQNYDVYYRGGEPRGYAERIITDERHREPLYEVQRAPRYYAPRSNRSYAPPPAYGNRGRDRMDYNPYTRRVEPRNARLQVPREPAKQRRAIPSEFRKQTVDYTGPEAPGTVVIDTQSRHLYLVQEGGTAIRYGVGVGRDGFQWTGTHKVTAKKEWPDWRPPKEMLARRPDLPEHMPGGPDNPLGARALYLGSTLYRIHGSNEPHTIGSAVSSGCFRMRNQDVIDLYGRVKVGARVVVL